MNLSVFITQIGSCVSYTALECGGAKKTNCNDGHFYDFDLLSISGTVHIFWGSFVQMGGSELHSELW